MPTDFNEKNSINLYPKSRPKSTVYWRQNVH